LNDRYRLDDELGRGGMGVVYRGHDTVLGRDVAVKVLSPDALGTDGPSRLIHEARAVAKLDHPNIVTVHDAGESDGTPYIVMQLVEGEPLPRQQAINTQQVVSIAMQLCEALSHAHEKGIIHRDVKPSNVIRTQDGSARLMDFGIARSPDSQLTQTGSFVGTLSYIAPEQAQGGEIDHRTDLYALGVLLYELCTGELPFRGEDAFSVIAQHLHAPVVPPVEKNPEVPAALSDLIVRLLGKSPEERPGSAQAVAEALHELTGGDELLTRRRTRAPALGQRHNLPAQPTSFVGREQELEEIDQLLTQPQCRLVTVLGPGGMGKTRLALEYAARHLDGYRDGAFFVSLAPVAAHEYIVPTIAGALQFPFDTHSSDASPEDQLVEFLGQREVLLVLDNFEHLMAGTKTLAKLLEGAPSTRVLVTSRERLNLQGEWTFDLQGMEYPQNGNGGEPADHAALSLFQDRARQVDSRFDLSDDQSPHAVRICRLVGGMPLGIELAAAWVTVLSCREIADEIEASRDFLATSMSDLPEKHRSLRAAFEHSWNLLTEEQKQGLRRLSLFRGGFRREAADHVADVNLLQLNSLVNKSLLRRNALGLYEVHELLRQYAEEKIADRPEEKTETLDRHSRYYVQYLSEREANLMGKRLLQTRDDIRAEIDNVRAAVHWASVHWDLEGARAALRIFGYFYYVQGFHEGKKAFAGLLEGIRRYRSKGGAPDSRPDAVYWIARTWQGLFASSLSQPDESHPILEECLPHLREADLPFELAAAHHGLGINTDARGEFEDSKTHFEESLAIARSVEAELLTAENLIWLGWNSYQTGKYPLAAEQFLIARKICERIDNQWALAFALSKLGLAAESLGDFQQAKRYHVEAREIFKTFGDPAGEAYTTSRLSMSAFGLGEYQEALQFGQIAFDTFQEIGHRWGMSVALCRIGVAALELDQVARAEGCFLDALERGRENKMIPVSLYALIGLGGVLARTGDEEGAAELFELVIQHPITPAPYREMTQKWLSRLDRSLSAETLAEIKQRAGALELDQVTERMLQRTEAG
jgi:predicted ATPase